MPWSVWLGSLYHGLSCKLKSSCITSKEIQANSPLVWQQMWEYFLWTLTNNNMFLNSCIEHEDCTETCKLVYPEHRQKWQQGRMALWDRGVSCCPPWATKNTVQQQIAECQKRGSEGQSSWWWTQVLTAKMFQGNWLHTSSIFGPDDWKPVSCWAHQTWSWRATSGLVASLKHIDPTQPFQQSN